MNKSQKIDYAIMYNPTLIPILFKDRSINKCMIFRKLKHVLPCRIGIEFELAGNFKQGFIKEHGDIDLEKFYNVLEINADSYPRASSSQEGLPLIEIRISICDYRQLSGLYKFMNDLIKYCKLHEGGGIHIHVDLSEYNIHNTLKEFEVSNYLTKRLTKIGKCFPYYKGHYNKRRIGIRNKGTWLNISRLNTLEFRTAPLTFDYSEFMSWLVKVIKIRQDLIHYCKLKRDYKVSENQPSVTDSVSNYGTDTAANIGINDAESLTNTSAWTITSATSTSSYSRVR